MVRAMGRRTEEVVTRLPNIPGPKLRGPSVAIPTSASGRRWAATRHEFEGRKQVDALIYTLICVTCYTWQPTSRLTTGFLKRLDV
jgi:hypothetical protein